MKNYINKFFLIASCSVFVSCGSSTSVPGSPNTKFAVPQESIYEVHSGGVVEAKVSASSQVTEPVLINSGSVLTLLEQSQDGQWIRVGIDPVDESLDVSQDLWISQESMSHLNMDLIDDADPYDADGYEVIPQSSEEQFSLRKKMTYCYRYVKQYLLKHGLVNTYLPGASAYMAATILPKYGFKKVNRTPAHAIVNDVCVYGGGNGGNGHIEIKTPQGWYYGYGYKASPIKNHPLKGCFHK
jgi:hypothetical protein